MLHTPAKLKIWCEETPKVFLKFGVLTDIIKRKFKLALPLPREIKS